MDNDRNVSMQLPVGFDKMMQAACLQKGLDVDFTHANRQQFVRGLIFQWIANFSAEVAEEFKTMNDTSLVQQ